MSGAAGTLGASYAGPDPGRSRRRLIVVSYHFPPDPAVGALRWARMSIHAAERGWGIDVIARGDPAARPSRSEDRRLAELPADIRVFNVPDPPLLVQRAEDVAAGVVRQLAGRSRTLRPDSSRSGPAGAGTVPSGSDWVPRDQVPPVDPSPRALLRAYWAWTDHARTARWARRAALVARRMMIPGVHQAVVTSGPPHMVHDAGRLIAGDSGVPFVMDMRDPWAAAEQLAASFASPAWLALAARFERRAVDAAALIVANTPTAADQLRAAYPDRRGDVVTVLNGFDETPIPPSRHSSRFVVAHAGTLYLDRDPQGLFRAAGRMIRELGLTPADFGLSFIGELQAVGGFPVREAARREGIEEFVSTGPPRPYAQAMAFLAEATMLVTMSGSSMAAIPAKTFECMRFDAWLLALSAPGSATARLLDGTTADVAAPGDVDAIAAALRRRYLEFRAGTRPVRIATDQRFSRRHQAELMLDALEARLGAAPGHRTPGGTDSAATRLLRRRNSSGRPARGRAIVIAAKPVILGTLRAVLGRPFSGTTTAPGGTRS